MSEVVIPESLPNWINGSEVAAIAKEWFDKTNPHNGNLLAKAARSRKIDIDTAVEKARLALNEWRELPAVQRGLQLHKIVVAMQKHEREIACVVAQETGKSFKDSLAEINGAVQLGLFYASEGQRLYGRTTTSGIANKFAMTIRQPIGIAGLIIAANTPIANIAWKVFPALICGNTAVLKSAEDAPATAWIFGKVVSETGFPPGVLNIVHGFGEEAGAPLVEHSDVGVISFTGSTRVGHSIQQAAASRFARISLELGGKNPLIICDDADLENAVKWVTLSAFSNAGQRCASTSRVIIFDSVYEKVRESLTNITRKLKVGPTDDDDFGPVINERQLINMLKAIQSAQQRGATVITGGHRLTDPAHLGGYYMAPTLIETVDPDDEISDCELFGPIAILYRAKDFEHALTLANNSPFGLTAAIHTRSIHRGIKFCERVESGVAVVNAGTYGSEPHMPFGGRKSSGNGTREPGTEALDIYSELKDIYINVDPKEL